MKKDKRKRALRHKLRNPVAKDLRTPKYKKRIEPSKKVKSQRRVALARVRNLND